ncbi:DsbA family protein [Aeromicrobium choanae]|uniref:Protein-disulfide isomerase n=1 Tax=Aeromicrobium choanae TaxID=1736691 RepID=A0A1T4YRP0_9ACTN|nr:thioredoxin domain-containing protein [Aeromicrobium choanae]SKB04422.1 Protein-disulfide isomerase [Aeromicrobium choanae]
MTNDRQARAARAEQMRKEREKAERKQRNKITVAIVVVVLVLIAAAGWGIKSLSDDNAKNTEVIEPANLTEGGVDFPATEGAASADAPVVELFEDFLCPACGSFEQLSGQFLQDQAASGAITLRFMPFSFLHNQSTNDYSRRATNVAMCAVDQDGPEAFWKVHDALYANQPSEGGAGPEDAELIDLATEAGVSDVESCVRTEKFVPWIDEMQSTFADERDVSGTPTVHIDGKASEARTPQELQAAIAEASKS